MRTYGIVWPQPWYRRPSLAFAAGTILGVVSVLLALWAGGVL